MLRLILVVHKLELWSFSPLMCIDPLHFCIISSLFNRQSKIYAPLDKNNACRPVVMKWFIDNKLLLMSLNVWALVASDSRLKGSVSVSNDQIRALFATATEIDL